MLGWALKRNAHRASNASACDDTQIEQPDTPAPVFAVRALKTALFGSPAARDGPPEDEGEPLPSERAHAAPNQGATEERSPTKPAGILLTPGTGTTRRKRVSFGQDVKNGAHGEKTTKSGLPDDCPGKFPSPFARAGDENNKARPKTKLTQALENSRKGGKTQASEAGHGSAPTTTTPDEDAWEEMDDGDRDPDVTVDLNEPHSRSGKYWKSQFQNYHADAKAEMEKLVKYKQLAKSYAKTKDSEALDLHEKLREEQVKVKKMEQEVAEMTRQVSLRDRGVRNARNDRMMQDLERQTALALEYRSQVEDLEKLLTTDKDPNPDDQRHRRKQGTSPRTQRTLLEAQRELRKARAQVKELGELRNQVIKLKAELSSADQRATNLADENVRLKGELSKSRLAYLELDARWTQSKTQNRHRDHELEKLKREHDRLKENAKTRFVEAEQVLHKKNEKISDLKDEIRCLKNDDELRNGRMVKDLGTSWQTDRENVLPQGGTIEGNGLETAEDGTTQWLERLHAVKEKVDAQSMKYPKNSSNSKPRLAKGLGDERAVKIAEDEALVSSRSLRERLMNELGSSSSSALSDRANLQSRRMDSRSSSSLHSYPSKHARVGSLDSLRPSHAQIELDNEFGKASRKPLGAFIDGVSRPRSADSEAPQIDLVQGNFARLGGPARDANSSTAWSVNTTKTTLPAGRRAAAIARLEAKKAERARLQRTMERNKENMLP